MKITELIDTNQIQVIDLLIHHKDNGPALIYSNGYEAWFKNGKRHREDGPASIYPGEYKSWYKNGRLIKHENNRNTT